MSIGIRPMRDGQEDAVAVLIRQLPKNLGLATVPKMTGQNLRDAKGLARVMVAEDAGLLLGICLWTMTYSSWRGCAGIYICDLYVLPHARGRKIGEKLLRGTALAAQQNGAAFIKLEVETGNLKAEGFYKNFGFDVVINDHTMILEPAEFVAFTKGTTA